MKKRLILVGVVILVLGVLLWIIPSVVYPITRGDISVEEVLACYQTGGYIKTFGNGCVDGCYTDPFSQLCTQSLATHCECGEDSCWSYETGGCVLTTDYLAQHQDIAWASYPLATTQQAKELDSYTAVRIQGRLKRGEPIETTSINPKVQAACQVPLVIEDESGSILVWGWTKVDQEDYAQEKQEFIGTIVQPNQSTCSKKPDPCNCQTTFHIENNRSL